MLGKRRVHNARRLQVCHEDANTAEGIDLHKRQCEVEFPAAK